MREEHDVLRSAGVNTTRGLGAFPQSEPFEVPQPVTTGHVVRGSVWSAAGQGAALVASLLATPFVLRLLGTDGYGVLVLIQLLLGYLAVADLGMGSAAIRFAASAHARGDNIEEVRVVWTSLAIAAFPSGLVALVLALLAVPIGESFGVPIDRRHDAETAIRLAAAVLVARSAAAVLSAPLLARLRLGLFTVITSGTAVAQIALVPLALLVAPTLTAALVVMSAASLGGLVLAAAASARLARMQLRWSVDRALLRSLMRFGGATMGVLFVGLALAHSEKLILARVAGIAALAYLAVAFTIARLTAVAPGALSQALLPAFARLLETADFGALQLLYGRAARFLYLTLAPLGLVLALVGQPFLLLWAGPDFARESLVPLYVLTVGSVIDGISYVPRNFLSAMGAPQMILRYQLINLLPYIIGATIFASLLGPTGAALAWSARAIGEAWMLGRAANQSFQKLGHTMEAPWGDLLLSSAMLIAPPSVAAFTGASWPLTTLIGLASIALFGVFSSRRLVTAREAWLLAKTVRRAMRRPT